MDLLCVGGELLSSLLSPLLLDELSLLTSFSSAGISSQYLNHTHTCNVRVQVLFHNAHVYCICVQCVSPHGVEIIIRGDVVFIITGESQLIAIALMYKVPEFFRAEWLQTDRTKSILKQSSGCSCSSTSVEHNARVTRSA